MSTSRPSSLLIDSVKNQRTETGKREAARELISEIRNAQRSEARQAIIEETVMIFQGLVKSPDQNDQITGIICIDELLSTEESVNFSRFSQTLRSVFNSPDIEVVRLGAKCIGHIASLSWTNSSEFVDQMQDEALESLQSTDRSTASITRKRASLFLLREIAENAPALFPNYLDRCLTHVWPALRQNLSQPLREDAALSFATCLKLVRKREAPYVAKCFQTTYNETFRGLSNEAPPHATHGALLIINELLQHRNGHTVARYRETCDKVLALLDHSKDKLVRRTAMLMLPRLAAFSPIFFVQNLLSTSMMHLLMALQGRDNLDRAAAFEAVGHLAVAVTPADQPPPGPNVKDPQFLSYCYQILNAVSEELLRRRVCIKSSLECVSLLGQALRGHLQRELDDKAIDHLFMPPLSPTLRSTLASLAKSIPSLLRRIQRRLLDKLYAILSQRASAPRQDVVSESGGASGRAVQSFEPCCACEYSGADLSQLYAFYRPPCSSSSGAPTPPPPSMSPVPVHPAPSLFPFGLSSTSTSTPAQAGSALPQSQCTSPTANHPASGAALQQQGARRMPWGGSAWVGPMFPQCPAPKPTYENTESIPCALMFRGGGFLRPVPPIPPPLPLPPTNAQQEIEIAVSLDTLMEFDFRGRFMTHFLRDVVAIYLDHSNPVLRTKAGLACSKLLIAPGDPPPIRGIHGEMVCDILNKLLQVATTDPDKEVRRQVLLSLDSRFDYFLAQADNLRAIFLLLNDESFEIRSLCVTLLGRLSGLNPARVQPWMRRTLMQVLTSLDFSHDPAMKEEGASLLGRLGGDGRPLHQAPPQDPRHLRGSQCGDAVQAALRKGA